MIWGGLGAVLNRHGAILGGLRAILGGLEPLLGGLGAVLSRLGAILGALGLLLAALGCRRSFLLIFSALVHVHARTRPIRRAIGGGGSCAQFGSS